MTLFATHVALNKTTTDGTATSIVDRTGKKPIKWFTLIVDEDAYLGINTDAGSSEINLKAGETYTSPEKVRVISLSVMRVSNDVTVRGSAWV